MRFLTPLGRWTALAILAVLCGVAGGWILAEAVSHDSAAHRYARPAVWAESGR